MVLSNLTLLPSSLGVVETVVSTGRLRHPRVERKALHLHTGYWTRHEAQASSPRSGFRHEEKAFCEKEKKIDTCLGRSNRPIYSRNPYGITLAHRLNRGRFVAEELEGSCKVGKSKVQNLGNSWTYIVRRLSRNTAQPVRLLRATRRLCQCLSARVV